VQRESFAVIIYAAGRTERSLAAQPPAFQYPKSELSPDLATSQHGARPMPLGFKYSSGGNFIPIIKYDAPSGHILRLDRVLENGKYVSRQTDITNGFEATFDFENIEIGHAMLQQGVAPDFHLVRAGNTLPPPPSDKHNQCARFMLKLAPHCAGDNNPIRECVATAAVFLKAIEALYDSFTAQRPANPDKLPVVKFKGTVPVTTKRGAEQFTNYQPVFEIIGWTARSDDLKFVPKGAL
jgi:hypothetical protein